MLIRKMHVPKAMPKQHIKGQGPQKLINNENRVKSVNYKKGHGPKQMPVKRRKVMKKLHFCV